MLLIDGIGSPMYSDGMENLNPERRFDQFSNYFGPRLTKGGHIMVQLKQC